MTKEELKKEAEEYALKQWEGNLPWSVIQKSYYDGALPREKRITELEAQIEQMKNSDTLCKLIGEQKIKIAKLEAQIEKMKSDVSRNIKWADQNKNWQMYCKLNAMINQWEIKENARYE